MSFTTIHNRSRAITGVAILAILAGAMVALLIGGYFYYGAVNKQGTPSSSNSTSTTIKSSTHITTSSVSTQGSAEFLATMGNILGNFSQMELAYNSNLSGYTNAGTVSYSIINSNLLNASNGVHLTKVNFTLTQSSGGGTSQQSYLVYYDPAWNVEDVAVGGTNATSSNAQNIADGLTAYFSTEFAYQNSFVSPKVFSQLARGNSAELTFGSMKTTVTNYTAGNLSENGNTVTNLRVSVGQLPYTSFSIVTYLAGSFRGSEGNGSFSFTLVSATLG